MLTHSSVILDESLFRCFMQKLDLVFRITPEQFVVLAKIVGAKPFVAYVEAAYAHDEGGLYGEDVPLLLAVLVTFERRGFSVPGAAVLDVLSVLSTTGILDAMQFARADETNCMFRPHELTEFLRSA